MKMFTGFGARRSLEKGSEPSSVKTAAAKILSPGQCLPALYDPQALDTTRRRSVDDSRFKEAMEVTPEASSIAPHVGQRRSVDNSHFRECEDLQAVRNEIWKASSLREGSTQIAPAMSSSASDFSSASDSFSSASVVSSSSETINHQLHHHAGPDGGARATVVGFDANSREAGVSATVVWTFRNVLQRGDVLVMVGVMDYIRGPLGYKVQVNDQTWLGANKKALQDEIRVRNVAWLELPWLNKLCEDAGVKLIVNVKAAARAEVAIVNEAVARGAVYVVLDKSLNNRRRRYYLERLSCDVTRMRRSGGVDSIRSLASIASDREKGRTMASPTSVLSTRGTVAPSPSPGATELQQGRSSSFNSSSLSSLVQLVEEKNVVVATSSSHPTIDEVDELFGIDHALMVRRVNMLLEPRRDLRDHGRDQLAMDDEGYDSDDLFSLAGDLGASRRPSVALFCPPELPSLSARSSVTAAGRSSHDCSSRSSLDSGPRLDKRLLPS